VGGKEDRRADALIVCATNADLPRLVDEGRFRLDLYHRIIGFTVEIPPLAEHAEDIPDLVDMFVERFSRERGNRAADVSPEAYDLLIRSRGSGTCANSRSACGGRSGARRPGSSKSRTWRVPAWTLLRQGQPAEAARGPAWTEAELLEMRHLKAAMEEAGGVAAAAGRILKVSEGAVRRRLEKYGWSTSRKAPGMDRGRGRKNNAVGPGARGPVGA